MAIQTPESIRRDIEEAENKMAEIAIYLGRDSIQESQLSVFTLQYKVLDTTIETKKRLLAKM